MERFKAYRIHDDGKFGRGRLESMSREELDIGNVVVRMAYAGVNFKDALTAMGQGSKSRPTMSSGVFRAASTSSLSAFSSGGSNSAPRLAIATLELSSFSEGLSAIGTYQS